MDNINVTQPVTFLITYFNSQFQYLSFVCNAHLSHFKSDWLLKIQYKTESYHSCHNNNSFTLNDYVSFNSLALSTDVWSVYLSTMDTQHLQGSCSPAERKRTKTMLKSQLQVQMIQHQVHFLLTSCSILFLWKMKTQITISLLIHFSNLQCKL